MEEVRFNRSQRWRLVLGKKAEEEEQVALGTEGMEIDAALDALYEWLK